MEGDVLKIINARAVTATGTLAYAWGGDKIKLAFRYRIVMQAFTANIIQTPPFLHANPSL